MKKLISANIGSSIMIEGKSYTLTNKKEFFINNTKAYRFMLFSEYETILVEIKREMALNYQIFKYSLVESIPHNQIFLSILGTKTLGYKNQKLSKNSIYKKVKIKKQKYELIKHIVEEDELPEDFQAKGYYQDEYGQYYFFTKKYSPLIKEFDKEKLKVWEYKQDNNTRLLIETKSELREKIFIYKGKELKKSEVNFITDNFEENSLPLQTTQIQDTLPSYQVFA